MAVAGKAVDDKTARVAAGDKVEDKGDEREYGEEGAEVAIAHHHVEPWVDVETQSDCESESNHISSVFLQESRVRLLLAVVTPHQLGLCSVST